MSGCEPCGCDPDFVGTEVGQQLVGWVCAQHREEAMKDTVPAQHYSPTFWNPNATYVQELTRLTNPRPTIQQAIDLGILNTEESDPQAPLKRFDMPTGQETRITDPVTGGQKGSKLQRFSLIPSEFLWALASHYGVGAKKYDDRNWEKGYAWSLSLDAHGRHLNAYLGTPDAPAERYDSETGTHHLVAAAWHLIALYIYDLRKLGTDDVRRNG